MKVYFNNSCKICKAEIDLYKKEKIQEMSQTRSVYHVQYHFYL